MYVKLIYICRIAVKGIDGISLLRLQNSYLQVVLINSKKINKRNYSNER